MRGGPGQKERRGSVDTLVLPQLTCFNLCLCTAATILPQQQPGTRSNRIPGSGYEMQYGMFFFLVSLEEGGEGGLSLQEAGVALCMCHVCVWVWEGRVRDPALCCR